MQKFFFYRFLSMVWGFFQKYDHNSYPFNFQIYHYHKSSSTRTHVTGRLAICANKQLNILHSHPKRAKNIFEAPARNHFFFFFFSLPDSVTLFPSLLGLQTFGLLDRLLNRKLGRLLSPAAHTSRPTSAPQLLHIAHVRRRALAYGLASRFRLDRP